MRRGATRALSMLLAILLGLLTLTSCGDGDVLSVEEIWRIIKNSANGKQTVTMTAQEIGENGVVNFRQSQSVNEKEGNLAHAIRQVLTVNMGVPQLSTTEIYQRKNGSLLTSYMRTDGGEWKFSQQIATESTGFSYGELFNSSYYQRFDPESGRYVSKEGLTVTVNDAEYTNLVVEIGDGYYSFSTSYTQSDGTACTLTIRYSDVGKVNVTLPDDLKGKL